MYTLVFYDDKTWEIVKGGQVQKQCFPDTCRFFRVPGSVTIAAFSLWEQMGFTGKELIEY